MNVWSPGPFDNDDASDFIADLVKYEFAAEISMEISAELAGSGRLGQAGARELNRALAAAAVVALLAGAQAKAPVALGGGWLTRHRVLLTGELKTRANNVIGWVMGSEQNAWYSYWEQAGRIEEARAMLGEYAAALS